ncbi:MAG TPA: threonine aldolase [Opitutae bacterium]|nr:threonine aldolase [Opitutae bacterium]
MPLSEKAISALPSPTLIVFPDRVQSNIDRMISIAGDASRLRPHVKTYKMAEIVRMQMNAGIQKFKCATLAEARMLVDCGAKEALLARQPIEPDIASLVKLAKKNPNTRVATIVDNFDSLRAIESDCQQFDTSIGIFLDINVGMNRTGIRAEDADALYRGVFESEEIHLEGLHVYDGHIRDADFQERKRRCDDDYKPVEELLERLARESLPVPCVVAGGSPTFPIHAQRENVDLSPGTTLLWDFGYGDLFRDLPFEHAALILTRVISKPGEDLVCFDLGHKAVASEMPHPRVQLLGIEDDIEFVGHSEEHLVARTSRASELSIGVAFLGIPNHICPTVALHNKVVVVKNGESTGTWTVTARDRILS